VQEAILKSGFVRYKNTHINFIGGGTRIGSAEANWWAAEAELEGEEHQGGPGTVLFHNRIHKQADNRPRRRAIRAVLRDGSYLP